MDKIIPDDSNYGKRHSTRKAILTQVGIGVLLGFAVYLLVRLLWDYFWRRHSSADIYMAIAELILVIVLGLEGMVAIWELSHNQQTARAAANAVAFDLFKMYLSIDFHKQVRRPAWFCLSKALKADGDYTKGILKGLAGDFNGDEVHNYMEAERAGHQPGEEDKEVMKVHDDYHRVQDILGFFTTLSLCECDTTALRMCNFFYDRWRVPLHRITIELQKYCDSAAGEELEKERRKHICCNYRKALQNLDKRFGLNPYQMALVSSPNQHILEGS